MASALSEDGRRGGQEALTGGRLRVRVAPGLRARSAFVLVLLSVVLGALVATALAAGIGFAVQALLHAVRSGPGP
ncbi:MAG: hypothetical protein ACRDZX_07880 [Acidimicrobiales bacterium]